MKTRLLLILVLFLSLPGTACGAEPPVRSNSPRQAGEAGDVLRTLRPGHPRLYVFDSELPAIKTLIENDAQVKNWYRKLQDRAERMLGEPVVEHKIIGPRMLAEIDPSLARISTLAFLYRLDGDKRKAERARQEMLVAAHFPDWNPPHFLDVGEMTHALAIGYDWLYEYLSAADRAVVREAIVEKGLKQGVAAYENHAWWTTTRFNWNQVCNGGLTLGALAVADEEPALAARMLDLSRHSIAIAMANYAPDGGWEEGPDYWNYGTEYTVAYLAAMRSALGTDFGLSEMPGIAEAGMFHIQSIGPTGLTFNFADADPKADAQADPALMFWLAQRFHRPLYAKDERTRIGDHPNIFHLVWSPGSVITGTVPEPPRDAIFRAVKAVYFRGAWNDPQAAYVGFKGGDNAANHSHLDLGTFVFDMLGKRWALDLGYDEYNLPEYFGKLRYTYYRLRTEAHNTLTVDGQNQDTKAKAPILAFRSAADRAETVADLTEGYSPKLQRALRGIALLDRRAVLVQDDVVAAAPVNVAWNFLTRARISLQGVRAVLTQDDKQIEARILSPQGARFERRAADPPPPQGQQPDVHNLTIRINGASGSVRIAVLLTPKGGPSNVALEPLTEWISRGKLDR